MPSDERNLTIEQALDLGARMAAAGEHENATGLFKGVLTHEPDNFEAIERLGASLFERKQVYEALYYFWRGLKIDRRNPMALTNYGLCVSYLGHWDEGLVDLERAAYHAEKMNASSDIKSLVYNNLGNTLERLGRYPEALDALDKCMRHNPQHPIGHYNRGIALARMNRHAEAIAALDQALAIIPDDPDARYNRGMARLLLGDLKGGFADYEARMLTSENKKLNLGMPADKKLEPGMDVFGKSILVVSEQGLGDDIQSFRFLEQLARLTGDFVQIVPHKATKDLLIGQPVWVRPENTPIEYDYWVALMSLPYVLGIDEESKIPPPVTIETDTHRFMRWRELVKCTDNRFNVGVCWAGNFQHKNDAHRSIPLEEFARVFDTPGCNFVSLQQVRPGEIEAFDKIKAEYADKLTTLELNDFQDTAAVILNLDVVVTVDTAVAHLAASLGVQTMILIPAFSTDWRWQLNRMDSPWYPSATLFRQPVVGHWRTPLDRICNVLAGQARRKAA